MRVFLMNDTSKRVHCGCDAVMESLRDKLSDHDIVGTHRVRDENVDEEAWGEAEAVVVNGEGTIHNARAPAVFLMEFLHRAQEEGKRTLLLNCVFQNNPESFGAVLPKLDLLTVREPLSAIHASELGGRPEVYPDLCVDTKQISGEPLEGEVVGSAGATAQFGDVFRDLARTRSRLHLVEPFGKCISRLRTAGCYITGQFHGVVAALLAGTPIVPVPSNTHKIEGLLQWIDPDLGLCCSESEIRSAISEVRMYRDHFHMLSEKFKSFLRLTKDRINVALEG
jgi:hypothetical protein